MNEDQKVRLRRERYPEDVTRVQAALIAAGYQAGRPEAERAWQLYSDSLAASWMILPDTDAKIVAALEPFLEECEE